MRRTSHILIRLMLGLIWLGPLVGCATTFHGKVVDYETREPIEGAAVVVYWYSARPDWFGENSYLKEVKETLTDRNGEWSIKGEKGREGPIIPCFVFGVAGLRYTREPEFIVFKPGYCSYPGGFSVDACKGKLKLRGNSELREGKTIELPKLTKREDRVRAQNVSIPGGPGALEKMKELIRLINEERKNLGLREIYKYQ